MENIKNELNEELEETTATANDGENENATEGGETSVNARFCITAAAGHIRSAAMLTSMAAEKAKDDILQKIGISEDTFEAVKDTAAAFLITDLACSMAGQIIGKTALAIFKKPAKAVVASLVVGLPVGGLIGKKVAEKFIG